MRSINLNAFLLLAVAGCLSKDDRVASGGDSGDLAGDTSEPFDGVLLGVELSPQSPVIQVGETVTFEVTAFYDDDSTAVVTDQIQ